MQIFFCLHQLDGGEMKNFSKMCSITYAPFITGFISIFVRYSKLEDSNILKVLINTDFFNTSIYDFRNILTIIRM